MPRLTGVPFLFGMVLALVGCRERPLEVAPGGVAPAVNLPVGPVPGGTVQPVGQKNPYSEDHRALAEGRSLFLAYNCYGCHGGHGGGGMGPSLRDEAWIYGKEDAQIYLTLVQGRAHGMPAWGTRVSQEQLWKLAAYVKSLRSPLEPDAPEAP